MVNNETGTGPLVQSRTPSVFVTGSSFFSKLTSEAQSSSGTSANTSVRFEIHFLTWNPALSPISVNWRLFLWPSLWNPVMAQGHPYNSDFLPQPLPEGKYLGGFLRASAK